MTVKKRSCLFLGCISWINAGSVLLMMNSQCRIWPVVLALS